jgi:F-type H+-transporting ATPase subunit a
MNKILICLFSFLLMSIAVVAQDHGDDSHGAETEHAEEGEHHEGGCHCHDASKDEFDPGETAFHHIMDANAFHVYGDIYIPLPCMLYAPEHGWSFFLSNKFELHSHGDGHKAIDGYVMHHGEVMRVKDASFPKGEVAVECFGVRDGEDDKEIFQVIYKDECYDLDKKSTWDGGMLGGGITSYYDFSVTKNVFTMLLSLVLLFFLFRSVAKAYVTRAGKAPKGIQSLIETIFVFIRDEVAIPFLGPKYEKYLPFLMSIFFFILGLNLIGQIPFFPRKW